MAHLLMLIHGEKIMLHSKTSKLKVLVKPNRPKLDGSVSDNLQRVRAQQRAIKRYYQSVSWKGVV